MEQTTCGFTSFTVSVDDTDTKVCGDADNGGAVCGADCCEAQYNWCAGLGCAGLEPCMTLCMADRGCCPTNYTVSPNDSESACGSAAQSGEVCKDDCCARQVEYCSNVSINYSGYQDCVQQRGCANYVSSAVETKYGRVATL